MLYSWVGKFLWVEGTGYTLWFSQLDPEDHSLWFHSSSKPDECQVYFHLLEGGYIYISYLWLFNKIPWKKQWEDLEWFSAIGRYSNILSDTYSDDLSEECSDRWGKRRGVFYVVYIGIWTQSRLSCAHPMGINKKRHSRRTNPYSSSLISNHSGECPCLLVPIIIIIII